MTARLRELGRLAVDVMMAIVGVDWFWSIWLTAVVGVEMGMTVAIRPLAHAGTLGLAVYLAGAGLASAVYAVFYEVVARRPVRADAAAESRAAARPVARSAGESMIPGAIGLALTVLAIFLFIALARNDLVILVIGLPIVFITAPLFSLFAFGYTRGEPTIGSFAYRKMPWGLVAFVVLAVLVRLARDNHWMSGEGALRVSTVVIVAAGLALAINLYRNWSIRRRLG
jgi:hypothetical protein